MTPLGGPVAGTAGVVAAPLPSATGRHAAPRPPRQRRSVSTSSSSHQELAGTVRAGVLACVLECGTAAAPSDRHPLAGLVQDRLVVALVVVHYVVPLGGLGLEAGCLH